MAMFFPSTHPRLWRPCWNAWCQRALSDGERGVRTPMRRTFADGCASTDEPSAKSIAQRVRRVIFFFMLFAALSIDTPHSPLFSLDHLVRSRQHVRRNRQADLLRCLQVDHKLKLSCLLYRQVSRFGAFQDLVDVVGRTPVTVRGVRVVGHESTSVHVYESCHRGKGISSDRIGSTTRSYTGLMAVVMMISTPMSMSMRVGFTNVGMHMRMLCPGP